MNLWTIPGLIHSKYYFGYESTKFDRPKAPIAHLMRSHSAVFRTNDDYPDDSGANLRIPKSNQVQPGVLLRFIKSSWFLIGNMQRPIHACLSQEMSRRHCPENAMCSTWWPQIVLEPLISEYSLTSESIIFFSRNHYFSATAGNDHFCEKRLSISNQKWYDSISRTTLAGLSFYFFILRLFRRDFPNRRDNLILYIVSTISSLNRKRRGNNRYLVQVRIPNFIAVLTELINQISFMLMLAIFWPETVPALHSAPQG
jgi:hypothetical protein